MMDEVDDIRLWSIKDPFRATPLNLSCGLLPFVRMSLFFISFYFFIYFLIPNRVHPAVSKGSPNSISSYSWS
ncbi:hypothetical protein BDV24DRAFT_132716 [Aspergillus arachidicola]|uniref:Uncharacterized protein n=1 Tax=Aspergillus arachidicola TaxID=656916 RepID=A0A5N6Y6I4_9EURO|nr:hypothetical protein BDV24DRAFT_132716 [Aspergillus arachidicola]